MVSRCPKNLKIGIWAPYRDNRISKAGSQKKEYPNHHYQVKLGNLVVFIGNGRLFIDIETLYEQVEWTFSRQQMYLVYEQKLNFSDVSHYCESLGDHILLQ